MRENKTKTLLNVTRGHALGDREYVGYMYIYIYICMYIYRIYIHIYIYIYIYT